MKFINSAPESFSWNEVAIEEVPGASGTARVKTKNLGEVRFRQVEYSPDYVADHWCEKGHIVYVLEGDLSLEFRDLKPLVLSEGMSWLCGDDSGSHRAKSISGALVLIID